MSRPRSTARRCSLLVVGLLAVILCSGIAAADPVDLDPDSDLDGEGTEAQPYTITNASELQAMRGNLTAHYELGTDVDAGNTSDWYGGDGLYPVGNHTASNDVSFTGDPFGGSFNGNGFEIQNLTISRNDESYVGLFGYANSTSSLGNVTLVNVSVNGTAHVGALVGESHGMVYDANVSGHVRSDHPNSGINGEGPSSTDGARTGALVGMLGSSGTVTNATATANVTGVTGDEARLGGLVGYSDGTIRDSTAAGNVTSATGSGLGGLTGRNDGLIRNASATGNVTAESANAVGGLVGFNNGNVRNSSATGYVDGKQYVGGLVGSSADGNVYRSSASGDVNGSDRFTGGLIGRLGVDQLVTKSYATGNVTGDDDVGGLVGYNQAGTVNESYATGVADGVSDVGGLVGYNKNGAAVRDSYATGSANGTTAVGGLVGRNFDDGGTPTIERSYAVVNALDGQTDIGGLVGTNDGGTVTNGYWDVETTGESTSAAGGGLSTFEMTSLVAKDYLFDFGETWNATDRYPRLAWENVSEPDPYPTATPGEGEVWLLNDSDDGYFHNYSINSSGDVRWLGEVIASPGSDDSAQLIEIAAGNATADYDTLVVGPGAYNLSAQQVNLTTDTGANLTRMFSHNGSDETEILRASAAGFASYDESVLRVDNPAASRLELGDSGTFDANGDGGFYIESDEGGAEDSPLIGVYDAASRYRLTVTNTTFGMWTNHGDTVFLDDSGTAFDLELDLVSHSGAVINASAASGLSVTNSTITEENDPRGNGLDGEGISFLTLDADGLDDLTVENVTITGATEATTVDGVIDITSLATDASVTMADLEIANTSEDAIRVATEIASLSLSRLNLTDIGTHGLTITDNVTAVTITDSEVTNTSATSFVTETTANVSQYTVTNSTITDSDGRGIYLQGNVGNATIENNTLTDSMLTPIDFGVNAGQSTPFEILDNHVDGSGISNSLIVVGPNAQVNITGNTLLNSGLRGIYVDAADAVIADTYIENSSQDRTDAHGIELDAGATNASISNTTVIDSHDAGIYVFPDNVTIRNATIGTTGGHGIEFAGAAADSLLSDSTITNTSDDALAVTTVTVPVTDLDLGSGTVSANVTDTNLNRTADVASNGDYQSGEDAIRLAKASGRVENLTLSYDTSDFDIDQRALSLWRRAPTWNSEPSIVDTDEQVVAATEAFDSEVGVLTTFASNVSITANDTTVDEGTAGTIELNATNGADGLENVTLNISDDGGLDGISDGDTVTTDATGEATVSFQESTTGTYAIVFRWTNNTLVSDTATVTVESAGSGGGGNTGGGNTGGGGTPPAPGVKQTVTDDGDTEVTGGRRGDVIPLSEETTQDTSSITGLDNIAVDGLSVELATDRDFFIDVETYERGEEDAVDAAADTIAEAEPDSDGDGTDQGESSTDTTEVSITASFERETETVSVGYVTVTHNLEPEDIAGATFEFSVRQAYLDELDVDPENVSLYRQTDQWTSLSTDYRERSSGRYRFEADSPGFSSFAIGTNAPLSIVINGSLGRTEITEGETATATATVTNRGQNPVTRTVNLTADGETVATETVTVDGGATADVPLAFEPAADVYDIAVDDVPLGSLTVITDGSQPPWWLLAVAIAVLLLVEWYRRREDDEDGNEHVDRGTDADADEPQPPS